MPLIYVTYTVASYLQFIINSRLTCCEHESAVFTQLYLFDFPTIKIISKYFAFPDVETIIQWTDSGVRARAGKKT